MPLPIPVVLVPHDPTWAAQALNEAARLHAVLGCLRSAIHHIGSTAIPGIRAKPIIDLLAIVDDLAALDARRADIEELGYVSWGEYGLTGRRYFTSDDATTGRRRTQLHAYAERSREAIERHLAFRDHLRSHPSRARDYDRRKHLCAALHESDSHAYGDCKSALIAKIEAEAMSRRTT